MKQDAVIVVPGTMGSELVDVASGRQLWGLRDARWYVQAWTSSAGLQDLALTEDERAGRYGRIRPGRLLRFPAFAPMLRGFEPYTPLLSVLRDAALAPAAVAEFPYDWRLPVAHNAGLLAAAIERHFASWRDHPAYREFLRRFPDSDPARVAIVAHSMGGLLARHICGRDDIGSLVRFVLTLGTPFYGAPKAAILLARGEGAPMPLPRRRLTDLARTLPSVYHLLPVYRCVDVGDDARRLTSSDLADLGADRALAEQAFTWHASVSDVTPWGHVQVVGAHQPTMQAITLEAGTASARSYTCSPTGTGIDRTDLAGDGTVPRESAQLPHGAAVPLAQSHGALARSREAVLIARDLLEDRRTGPWQGAGDHGLDVTDVAPTGSPVRLAVTGTSRPRDLSCMVRDVSTGRVVAVPALQVRDRGLAGRFEAPAPGLYEVELRGGGMSPTTEMFMATPP
jgi:hypothetical protein